ncbi:hypothetical protein [Streptomyces sp. NPDC059166]|uniref:hypothetical protein n=1 Tax=Streptomyces sp. NPDC059166 TaxID=3346752 RepID=UPI0036BA8C4F
MNDILDFDLDGLSPVDDLTVQVDPQTQRPGARCEVLDTYTSGDDTSESWTLVRDSRAAQAPVRLFHEEWDHDAGKYTMREGAFADVGVARAWLDERSEPLPESPEYSDHIGAVVRSRVTLSRSAGTSPTPQTGLDAPRATAAVPIQRPAQGRLL